MDRIASVSDCEQHIMCDMMQVYLACCMRATDLKATGTL